VLIANERPQTRVVHLARRRLRLRRRCWRRAQKAAALGSRKQRCIHTSQSNGCTWPCAAAEADAEAARCRPLFAPQLYGARARARALPPQSLLPASAAGLSPPSGAAAASRCICCIALCISSRSCSAADACARARSSRTCAVRHQSASLGPLGGISSPRGLLSGRRRRQQRQRSGLFGRFCGLSQLAGHPYHFFRRAAGGTSARSSSNGGA
jgi:hypothetical protein